MAMPIMIQGTASDAGKSLVAAGLCRIFKQEGYRVAPFKSQNMASSSFITSQGLELGRAQAMQAEAAGIQPQPSMNPILLKPSGEASSMVVLNGKPYAKLDAADYFAQKKELLPHIMAAYRELEQLYSIIVIEGAGSPAEINLKQDDFVNMGMAKLADSPVLLVGDIDRGGVFASLYGTLCLLEPEERARVKGIIINKFRGDVEILKPGLKQFEALAGIPVIGVIPYADLGLGEEARPGTLVGACPNPLDFAMIRLPRISNPTEFRSLERLTGTPVRFASSPQELGSPSLVILPGTSHPAGDLVWMRQSGMESAVKRLAAKNIPILGVGGGFHLMGMTMAVQAGGQVQLLPGLELLPFDSVPAPDGKPSRTFATTSIAAGLFGCLTGIRFSGYQAVPWQAVWREDTQPFALMEDGTASGGCKNNAAGIPLHGLFDTIEAAQRLADSLANQKDIQPDAASGKREAQYDKLADLLRQSLDMDYVLQVLRKEV